MYVKIDQKLSKGFNSWKEMMLANGDKLKKHGMTIAFAIENIVMAINKIHKIEGVNFVKPSDIFAKLFAVIPNKIPITKNIYPNKGFKINPLKQFC